MANRSDDWLRQGEADLELAREAQRLGRHEWACFAPFEHYGTLQSEQGLEHARSIIEFVRSQMA